jgi:hypothetical protein
MTKNEVRDGLYKLTGSGCSIQHGGFPCGTCFSSIDFGKDEPKDLWGSVLLYRGDYKNGEFVTQTREQYLSNIRWLKNFIKSK